MQFKAGVSQDGVAQVIKDTWPLVDSCYREFGAELVITSTRDGEHGLGGKLSFHPFGLAYDARSRNVDPKYIPMLLKRLRDRLPWYIQIVDETTKIDGPHIHFEFDPRK